MSNATKIGLGRFVDAHLQPTPWLVRRVGILESEENGHAEAAGVRADSERRRHVVRHLRLSLRPGRHHPGTLRQDRAPGRTQEPLPSLDDVRRRRHTVADWPAYVNHSVTDHHQLPRRQMQYTGRHEQGSYMFIVIV